MFIRDLQGANMVQNVKGEVVGQVCWGLKILAAQLLAGAFP